MNLQFYRNYEYCLKKKKLDTDQKIQLDFSKLQQNVENTELMRYIIQ